ncbi:hypothetical protein MRB53_001806 [Persea americana]|uniref:Uncharacterized protein n=1 Tax=Persea americana TaxID=3435 RepID=A0ACC2MTE2_PERAE|nr:hypothetical protein MRB53_001806 [Persea americana]
MFMLFILFCFTIGEPLTIDEIVAVKTNKAVMHRPLQSVRSPDLLECFRMFHSCGCCYVPVFGETEHDSSQQLTSVPIEEHLDDFGRVLDVGKANYGFGLARAPFAS